MCDPKVPKCGECPARKFCATGTGARDRWSKVWKKVEDEANVKVGEGVEGDLVAVGGWNEVKGEIKYEDVEKDLQGMLDGVLKREEVAW